MMKLLVVGDTDTGKTCIINRYIHNKFDITVKPTIACEYNMKLFHLDGATLRVNIWDIGQEIDF